MFRTLVLVTSLVFGAATAETWAQVKNFQPVTEDMLENPSPDDWLMFSRTYDNQRFSPLRQVNRENVGRLQMAWTRGLRPGSHEHIPIVYRGVMYVATPPAVVQALDATNGDLIWEYRRRLPEDLADYVRSPGRSKSIGIYQDLILYAAPDGYMVGLDAVTGKLRWEELSHDYKTTVGFHSGLMVADGKAMAGRSCGTAPDRCFISAHDAVTGKELWKFYTAPAPDEPGGDSWGKVPVEKRITSPWGLPGSYDPVRKLVYWGIANPDPYTRLKRHGDPDAIPRFAPADLYSNSTVALDPETGKLAWYYQHLPGDDWDADHTQERILIRTSFDLDPHSVKWISPKITPGQEREILITLGEPGGIWALDRETGEFLWATPFPYDIPDFNISHIDVETGVTHINWDKVFKKDKDRVTVCFHNTKSYWPMAYHPAKNSLFIPFHDLCLDMQADMSRERGYGIRKWVARPGSDPDAFATLARVNVGTGQVEWRYSQRAPGNGATLATAGDLIFWGDMNRRFRAFDADNGKILWESILGGIIQMSTITYAVDGKQYVAVLTGDGLSGTGGPLRIVSELATPRGHNAIYAFALPD